MADRDLFGFALDKFSSAFRSNCQKNVCFFILMIHAIFWLIIIRELGIAKLILKPFLDQVLKLL